MSAHPAVTNRQAGWAEGLQAARDSSAWLTTYLRLAAAADATCALLGCLIALVARFDSRVQIPVRYQVLTALFPLLWCTSLAVARGYETRLIGAGSEEFRKIIVAGAGLATAIAIFSYASKIPVARGWLVVALPDATLLDLLARYALRKRLHRRQRTGACVRRAVAVGPPAMIAELIASLRRKGCRGLAIVAACVPQDTGLAEIAGVPICGDWAGVPAAAAAAGAGTVAVTASAEFGGARLRDLAWQLEEAGLELYIVPGLAASARPRAIHQVAGLPLLRVPGPDLAGRRQAVKATTDRVVAGLALILLAPLLLAVALAVRLTGKGPVLFRQTRLGKGGQPFTLYKFRTMIVDAEHRRAALESRNEMNGVLFKIRRDPRLTSIGGWLRRWSLDELPQFINVLRGEMSLVGPRPWTPLPYAEAVRSCDHVRRRLLVKPGITGLWQVAGRADLPWQDAVELDLRYVEDWSLLLDTRILLRTWSAVIRGSGAY